MPEHVTLIRPDMPPLSGRGLSSGLPPDLLEQVRGRVRLLAGFFLFAFAFDVVVFLFSWTYVTLTHTPIPPDSWKTASTTWANVGGVIASGALWWGARSPRVSPSLLHTLGLIYEVVICFVIAMLTFYQYYVSKGILPDLTWVPAVVIMFPLVMPGPPRRMLAAAITAGAMSPLALLVLNLWGKVPMDAGAFFPATFGPFIGATFAYLGARVVYGLGREVAAARELGSYRLEEKLGQGGMGEVWRARHRMLARPAAIKLIRPGLQANPGASDDAARRFEREAQAIARLRSPHTVDIFDFGVSDDGAFYYVMELLDGLDADALVRRFGPLPAARVVYLLRQVCHSLAEAESCNLVHRDIKPANIFLCRYGLDCDFVKVLDFGIVKAPQESGPVGPALTGANAVHGTPAFMAPEQALGHPELDGRADIYATGCVAYWLLTGELVFNADNQVALLMQHIQETPVPPSSRTELPISPAMDRLVLACLAKSPKDRPQSATELSRLLGELEDAGGWTEAHGRAWWETYRPARGTD